MAVFCCAVGVYLPARAVESNIAETEKELKAALKKDPKEISDITRLGVLYWDSGRRALAIKWFRKAIKINPDYAPPYFFIGEAYFFERKPEKAAENYELFMKKMSDLPEMDGVIKKFYISTLHKMGSRFWAMRMEPDSLKVSTLITELDPNDAKAHYNLAVYYYNYEHNRVRAFRELKKVILLEPKSRMAAKAEFFIDYLRRNPDSRIIGDFSFMDED